MLYWTLLRRKSTVELELRTGGAWFAFARSNDTWHAHLFADYVLGHLAGCGVDLSGTTVQTDNGSEFIGSTRKVRGGPTLFERTVEHYTGRMPVTIFPGSKTSQSDVEAFHRLVEDEFLAVEDLSSRRRLLGCGRILPGLLQPPPSAAVEGRGNARGLLPWCPGRGSSADRPA